MISLAIFANTLLRLASIRALVCLILAHLLCPAMTRSGESEHQQKHRQKKKGNKASSNNVVNHIPKNIGQAHIAAVVTVSKFEVIQPKKMKNGRVNIMNVHGVVDGIHT